MLSTNIIKKDTTQKVYALWSGNNKEEEGAEVPVFQPKFTPNNQKILL